MSESDTDNINANPEANNDWCKVCDDKGLNKPNKGPFLLCDGCNYWYHCRCAGKNAKDYIGKNAPLKDSSFICDDCPSRVNHVASPQHFDQENTAPLANDNETEKELEGGEADGGSQPEQQSQNQSLTETSTQSAVPSTNNTTNEEDSNQSQSTTTSETEYIVDRILNHRPDPKNNEKWEYYVKWQDYDESENSWEPELMLEKCYFKIAVYKRKNGLGAPVFPKPVDLGGASIDDDQHNINNWVKPEDVVQAIKMYRDNKRKRTLPIKLIKLDEGFETITNNETTIYILFIYPHLYVALRPADNGRVIIADGENTLFEDEDCKELISQVLNRELKIVKFQGQKCIDFCGSSAVLIADEMERIYVNNITSMDVIIPTYSKKVRIVKKFHKEPSVNLNHESDIRNNFSKLRCPHENCNYWAYPKERGGYYAHMRMCKFRPEKE